MTQPATILVVDDDPGLLTLLRVVLKTDGFIVEAFDDARAALAFLATSEQPGAIVLDLRMPEMDGREFFREARRLGITSPVLIASAFGAAEAKAELGAEAALAKPFDPADVSRLVRSLLPA